MNAYFQCRVRASMKWPILATVPHGWEKPPIFGLIEIVDLIASAICSLETVLKRKRLGLWLKTSIHNRAPDAVVLLIFQVIQHLCSIPAIAFFEQEQLGSTLCGSGIFALAVPQRSEPASSGKRSGGNGRLLLPHENEVLKKYLRRLGKMFRPLAVMNQRATGQQTGGKPCAGFQPPGSLMRFTSQMWPM